MGKWGEGGTGIKEGDIGWIVRREFGGWEWRFNGLWCGVLMGFPKGHPGWGWGFGDIEKDGKCERNASNEIINGQ